MEWMLMPFRRYAEFSGRSRRKEYWMFFLFNWLVGIAVGAIFLLLFMTGMSESELMVFYTPLMLAYGLFALAAIIPGIAVSVRRLHDTDRSGWALLYGLIPIVGPFLLLVFYVSEGTQGPNRFGPDPVDDRPMGAALAV